MRKIIVLCRQEPSNKILTHSQSQLMHRKHTYRQLTQSQRGLSYLKLSIFTWVWNTTLGEEEVSLSHHCTRKANEYEQTAEETLYLIKVLLFKVSFARSF